MIHPNGYYIRECTVADLLAVLGKLPPDAKIKSNVYPPGDDETQNIMVGVPYEDGHEIEINGCHDEPNEILTSNDIQVIR